MWKNSVFGDVVMSRVSNGQKKEVNFQKSTDVKVPEINRVEELFNTVKDILKERITYNTAQDLLDAFKALKKLEMSQEQQGQFKELGSKAIDLVLLREGHYIEDKGRDHCAYAVNVINEALGISKSCGAEFTKSQTDRIGYLYHFRIGQNLHYGLEVAKSILSQDSLIDCYITWTKELIKLGKRFKLKLTEEFKRDLQKLEAESRWRATRPREW